MDKIRELVENNALLLLEKTMAIRTMLVEQFNKRVNNHDVCDFDLFEIVSTLEEFKEQLNLGFKICNKDLDKILTTIYNWVDSHEIHFK
jgi:regulator of replication initiation timing